MAGNRWAEASPGSHRSRKTCHCFLQQKAWAHGLVLVLGMGSCSPTSPRGHKGCQGQGNKLSNATDMCRLMEHGTVRRGTRRAAQLSGLTRPCGWVQHPSGSLACLCLCVRPSSLWCGVWHPCECGNWLGVGAECVCPCVSKWIYGLCSLFMN